MKQQAPVDDGNSQNRLRSRVVLLSTTAHDRSGGLSYVIGRLECDAGRDTRDEVASIGVKSQIDFAGLQELFLLGGSGDQLAKNTNYGSKVSGRCDEQIGICLSALAVRDNVHLDERYGCAQRGIAKLVNPAFIFQNRALHAGLPVVRETPVAFRPQAVEGGCCEPGGACVCNVPPGDGANYFDELDEIICTFALKSEV